MSPVDASVSLVETFGLALLGGLVLNVMPCVLPVLTMKAFHVVENSGQNPRERKLQGMAYAAGTMTLMIILATLAVLANVVLGRAVHWGSQFSSPYFVAGITAVVFAFALNALGVFEITVSMSGSGNERKGLAGSFANGLFAAIMATPCSAPFLGTAVAFALGARTPWWQTEIIFALIGFGLALPYLLLTFVPKLGSKLPKPGPWMETCKQLMGFTLLLTAVWLFRSLQVQVTEASANSFLFFLVFVAIGLWAGGRFGGGAASTRRRWSVRAGQALVIGTAGFFMLSFAKPEAEACAETPGRSLVANDVIVDGHLRWTPYTVDRVAAEHARNRPVFLDFTAEWCSACKINEAAFIETDLVRGAFADTGILPMKLDMTKDHPEGDKLVESFGRSGIPIYVILFPDGTVDLLPVVINAEMVAERLHQASKKFPLERFLPRPTDRDRPPS